VPILGYYIEENTLNLFQPHCQSLGTWLKEKLSDLEKKMICIEIASAID